MVQWALCSMLAAVILAAGAVPGRASYLTRIEGWEGAVDDRVEFPAMQGMTLMIDGQRSPSYMRKDGARLDVMAYKEPEAKSILDAMLARGASVGCAHEPPASETLQNGWQAFSAELRCGQKTVAFVAASADGRAYVVSGNGFPLAEVRAYAGSGRVIPAERRPSAAAVADMNQKAREFDRQVDKLSGGPSLRAGFWTIVALAVLVPLIAVGLLVRFLWKRLRPASDEG